LREGREALSQRTGHGGLAFWRGFWTFHKVEFARRFPSLHFSPPHKMPAMDHDLIFYEFSRSKVERGDFTHFLNLYALDKLPTGRRLRDLMDRMVFCIEGYDDDVREIHAIPEVRKFYSAFHDAWPYWLFFCNLDAEVMKAMVFCCLPSLNEMKVDGKDLVAITFDPLEILGFLKKDFGPMNLLCERAEMFEDRIYGRTKRLFEYFGLPFDAPLIA
jgi:hypothetical protein